MKVARENAVFSPILISLETKEEVAAFMNIMRIYRAANGRSYGGEYELAERTYNLLSKEIAP